MNIKSNHILYSNRFDSDSRPYGVVTQLLMFMIMLTSVVIGQDISQNYVLFILAYGVSRFFIVGLYFSAAKQYPDKSGFAKSQGLIFAVGAAISMSAAAFDFPAAVFIFYAGIIFDVVARKFLVKDYIPVDRDQLLERVGLFAIILLG